ncbi:kinetochore Sim4 complex subunit Fta4 [Xylariaceae sp. FL1272]|nr:kinetochore Sim4 complex subunit Fta4 [Xylariaceae sp. FL1272]
MAPPTIIAHKSTFLTTQTLQLSKPLAPSRNWREANDSAEDGLSARAVEDALYRLNNTLTQHTRRVYAPQATRHVAEQIETLFHDAAESALRGEEEDQDEDGEAEGVKLNIGADFATDEAIVSLPSTWDIHNPREATDNPLEAHRYTELAAELNTLSARRKAVRERVERLRKMAASLKPFDSSRDNDDNTQMSMDGTQETKTSVQENLITRNGDIETELERMRLLLARVSGRIAQFPGRNTGDEKDYGGDAMDLDERQRDKTESLLDGL